MSIGTLQPRRKGRFCRRSAGPCRIRARVLPSETHFGRIREMPAPGPLVALRSCHHKPFGVVPPEVLVQAASDAGYRVAALADQGTVRGAPAFVAACEERSIQPVVGMTVLLSLEGDSGRQEPVDVLSLGESLLFNPSGRRREEVLLLATSREGYQNLLRLKEAIDNLGGNNLPPDRLLGFQEGLFLVAGLPGTSLEAVVSGYSSWRPVSPLKPLLSSWPRQRIAFGGLRTDSGEGTIARQLARLKDIPAKLPPIAIAHAAYRNQNERFWGIASQMGREGNPQALPSGCSFVLENRDSIGRAHQGLSRSLKMVEKVAPRESNPSEWLRCTTPVYPSPRGTDTTSFFWTLAQEVAISTGHIRMPGGKERLYEEFQYLKQTPWPGIWLILWDLRRRMGFPPGTLRLSSEWICSSLFAHLLGFTRVDPLRERIIFSPEGLETSPSGGFRVQVEVPMGWEDDLLRSAESLFGEGHVKTLREEEGPTRDDLIPAGYRLLPNWEELGFPGDRPVEVPPWPSYISERRKETDTHSQFLLLSGTNLNHAFAVHPGGHTLVEASPVDAVHLGGTVLECVTNEAQTLSATPRYRGIVENEPVSTGPHESLTEWIESHKGKLFHGKAYADDTGRFDLLAQSSCLFRLVSLPSSIGYHPLLWWWIQRTSPKNLGDLADLLALSWHWTYWAQRPSWRTTATQRKHPLVQEEERPPWWDEWSQFAESAPLQPRLCGTLSSAIETNTRETGGWLLYEDQIDRVLEQAFVLSPDQRRHWLSCESGPRESLVGSSDGAQLWDVRVRSSFLRFLGNPFPLPPRTFFLKKSEELLAAAASFADDPAAVVAVLSFLFPKETRERREVYSLLRERGVQLNLPCLSGVVPFDITPEKNQLTLGLLNVLGIGPNIVSELCGKRERSASIHEVFKVANKAAVPAWENWLKKHANRSVGWQTLSSLIRLGMCDAFLEDRSELVRKARHHLSRRARKTNTVQQTLFHLESETGATLPEEENAWNIAAMEHLPRWKHELDCLRFGASGTPLEDLRGLVPDRWIEGTTTLETGSSPWMVVGWVHEVDMFFSEDGEPPEDSENLWMTFNLFTNRGKYRLVDREGHLSSQLPVPRPDFLRLDGHRIHLREPWVLLCEIRLAAQTNGTLPPIYTIEDGETLNDFGAGSADRSEILVFFESCPTDLPSSLDDLLHWFEFPEAPSSVHLTFAISESASLSVLGRRSLRRLVRRLGTREVVPAGILLRMLEGLPGVEKVVSLPDQVPLFPSK